MIHPREAGACVSHPEKDDTDSNAAALTSLVVLGEVLTLAGHLATNLALLMAPVALALVLVLVVEGLQPVFVFLIGTAATLFFPRFVTESLTKKAITQKLVCLAAVCAASVWLQ